jgi:hypothetical protein
MGPLENGVKVAGGAVDALKQQPLVLALVLLQALVLAAVLYNSIHRQTATDKQFAQLFQLLDTCLKGNAPQRGDLALPIPLPRSRPEPPEP